MIRLLFLVAATPFTLPVSSIYDIPLLSIDGSAIDLHLYQGKKILIVNIATGSKYAPQLASLEQLHEQYSSKLVIIAIPSNSFGNEPKDNSQLKSYLSNTWHIQFPIAARVAITGASQHALYHWLSNKTENDMINTQTKNDFKKYLINEQGRLVGLFSATVDPLSDELVRTIK